MKRMNKKGFTMMELLVVFLIIAVLAAIAIPVFLGAIESSKVKADAATLKNVQSAARVYFQSNNNTVPTMDALVDDGYFEETPTLQAKVNEGKTFVFSTDDNGLPVVKIGTPAPEPT